MSNYYLCSVPDDSVEEFLSVLYHGGGVEKVVKVTNALEVLIDVGEDERTKPLPPDPDVVSPNAAVITGIPRMVLEYQFNGGRHMNSYIVVKGPLSVYEPDDDGSGYVEWFGHKWKTATDPVYRVNSNTTHLSLYPID